MNRSKFNHKRNRILAAMLAVLLLVALLGGCARMGSAMKSSDSLNSISYSASEGVNEAAYEMADEAMGYEEADVAEMGSTSTSDSEGGKQVKVANGADEKTDDYTQKLIYTYSFNFQTREFDKSLEYATKLVNKYNGYIEGSSVSGTSEHYASMTIRIPVEHKDAFLEESGSIGTLTSKEVNTEDITLQYYDLQAHIETLNTQRNRLLELLKKAKSVSDITKIQNSLADVEYEINSYNTQMKIYENQVDYMTVYIYLDEVNVVTVTEEDGFITRITKGFMENSDEVINGLIATAIWAITMIPYFLVLAVILLCVKLILKRIRKGTKKDKRFGKKRQKKVEEEAVISETEEEKRV